MKKRSILAMLLISILALSLIGCAEKEEGPSIEEVISIDEPIPVEEPEPEPVVEEEPVVNETEEEEEDEDLPPREGMVRSVLTNEWIDGELAEQRPLAVMYPINREAQPQYGLDRVDIFYEIMEEGDMSRQLGIIQDWEDLGRIGNIRSIRDYFVYAALEYDPIIIHFGGPELYCKTILTRADVENINGVGGAMGPDYGAYYRVPEGSRSEHTAYTDGSHVASAIERAGFSRTHREQYYDGTPHFNFASVKEPNTLEQYDDAQSAKEVNMAGAYPVTKSSLRYNEEDEKYYKTLYGNAQCDAVTGEQMAFDNIFIQNTYYEVRDDHGYLAFQMHDTTRDGYFITRGKMIHVTWKKEGDYKATRYYDDNGNEVEVNTGKTMIFVVKQGNHFEIDGRSY